MKGKWGSICIVLFEVLIIVLILVVIKWYVF